VNKVIEVNKVIKVIGTPSRGRSPAQKAKNSRIGSNEPCPAKGKLLW